MAVKLIGSSSGYVAEVNAAHELRTTLSPVASDAGFAKILDSTGAEIRTTEDGGLYTSMNSVILVEQVDGSALNTNIWTTSTDTMTVTQGSGFITLNASGLTTASKYAILNSIKNIPLYGDLPLVVTFNAKLTVMPPANSLIEFGIGSVATNAAPTDGCFFRYTSAGQFLAICSNGGTETASAPLTVPTVGDVTLFKIILVEDLVQFFVDDVLVDEVVVPSGQAYPTNAGRIPVFARVYNTASVPVSAPQLGIGQVEVVQQSIHQNRNWMETLMMLGKGGYQSPITSFAQTANHTNSTSPTSATLSNTVAGYTTLGGRYQFAAVGAAATDFALFAYQVPAGYQLVVTGIRITAMNTGVAVLITPTVLDWGLGINSSAVSLATADSPPTTWAPRRIPLGMQGFTVAQLAGTPAPDIVVTSPQGPLAVVDAGRFLHVILQCPVGTATVSQVIRGDVHIIGYFE